MNFAFASTMTAVPWGGSETLWHGTALRLSQQGHSVHAYRQRFDPAPRPLVELARAGVTLTHPDLRSPLVLRLYNRVAPRSLRRTPRNPATAWLAGILSPRVLLSAGSILDEFTPFLPLASSGIPYVIVIHAAAPEIWPPDHVVAPAARLLSGARRVYFVSAHNRTEIEEQLGLQLAQAAFVRCPLNIPSALRPIESVPPYPETTGLRLACVGRLNVAAKGQDVLLRTLALDKWKSRNVSLTLYGEGPHRKSLGRLARRAGLDRVQFAGQVADIGALWGQHNLGVLASRYEGLPLSLMEAMMLGRANVTTRVCGNPEVVDDNRTGFLAAAPTVEAFDEALERAWARRTELPAIGLAAARAIREFSPPDPCGLFAGELLQILA